CPTRRTSELMSPPSPSPTEGLEVLWNHTLRFRGHSLGYTAVASSVTANGNRMDVLREYQYFINYSVPGARPQDLDNNVFFLKRKTLAPAKLSGSITLVHE